MGDVEPETVLEERFPASPPSPVDLERRLAERASRQYGVIGLDQLRRLGFTEGQIRYRVRCHRLRHIHQGVYSVGAQPLTQLGHWWAALLAARPSPALSHRS